MDFSSDRTRLVIYGSARPDPPSVLLLDGETLEIEWTQPLPDVLDGRVTKSESGLYFSWSPGVVFSSERQELYIVHADADRLTTVDFQGRSVRSFTISPRPTWIERLLAITAEVAEAKFWPEGARKSAVLSPDGTRLYLIGRTWVRTQNADGEWKIDETVHPPAGDRVEERLRTGFPGRRGRLDRPQPGSPVRYASHRLAGLNRGAGRKQPGTEGAH